MKRYGLASTPPVGGSDGLSVDREHTAMRIRADSRARKTRPGQPGRRSRTDSHEVGRQRKQWLPRCLRLAVQWVWELGHGALTTGGANRGVILQVGDHEATPIGEGDDESTSAIRQRRGVIVFEDEFSLTRDASHRTI